MGITLEEFAKRLGAVQEEFPDESIKALRRSANRMRKALKDNSPDSGKEHKRKLNKSWRVRIKVKGRDDIEAQIYSTAPHFHLVDRGYVMKNAHNQVTGFKQGLHFVKKTADEESDNVKTYMIKSLYKKLKDTIANG